jgi:peroxiredoxin Q/BCP
MAKLSPGDTAPAISLPDQDGKTQRLADRRGRWVLVYFYPRDDTPGCTLEACGLRDAWSDFAQRGIEVFGISGDSVKSHRKFADKFKLPFTLLSDESKAVIRAYGAFGKKKFMGREFDGILRQSFLVDPRGRLARIYSKVKPAEHAAEVLMDVAALSAGKAATAPSRKAADPAPKTVKTRAKKRASRAKNA